MTEVNISARIPQVLEEELEWYMDQEHLEKSAAVRKLLFKSLEEWKIEHALKLLADGKTTLSKAAEIAGIDIWTLTEKIKQAKTQWVKDSAVQEDLEAF